MKQKEREDDCNNDQIIKDICCNEDCCDSDKEQEASCEEVDCCEKPSNTIKNDCCTPDKEKTESIKAKQVVGLVFSQCLHILGN
jgi:hypothetical protein